MAREKLQIHLIIFSFKSWQCGDIVNYTRVGMLCEGLTLLAQNPRSDIQNHIFFSCMQVERLAEFTLFIAMRLGQLAVLIHSYFIYCEGFGSYSLKVIQRNCQGWGRLPLLYKGRLSKDLTNSVTTSSWNLHGVFVFGRPALWTAAHSSLMYYLEFRCLRFLQTWKETSKEFPLDLR